MSSRASSRYVACSLPMPGVRWIIALGVWSLTEVWIVDAPENDKLVAILYQALQSPIQCLCTTLVGARCAQEDAGVLGS